mgnify:CR=1 FL=1
MIKDSTFIPAKYAANPHIQSMWPTFIMRRQADLKTRRERLELTDGDFLDLEWYGNQTGPIIILLHGVTGNMTSPYIKYLMPELAAYGWQPVMMYYRGYSGEHNRLNIGTHAGQTDDLATLIKLLKQRHPNTALAALGFSQGGNMLLKYLGEYQNKALLNCALAVSPPFQLRSIANRIRHGISKFYQWYLLRELREFYRTKFQYRPAPFDLKNIDRYHSFWQFDDKITAPLNGFKGAVDYYRQASCGNYLASITTPTLIIHAKDDTFMSADIIPTAKALSNTTILELSAHGGHLGFVSGTLFKPHFWLADRIPDFLQNYL